MKNVVQLLCKLGFIGGIGVDVVEVFAIEEIREEMRRVS
jgi:hypothetical protein